MKRLRLTVSAKELFAALGILQEWVYSVSSACEHRMTVRAAGKRFSRNIAQAKKMLRKYGLPVAR